jgi:thiol-disulfide isomerase/thioredoxin
LFHGRIRSDGSLEGGFWSRDTWHETWTARRDSGAALPDAFGQTRWNYSAELGDLSYPDLDGVARSPADPLFAGKARIIYVFGSWCPNCQDATELLVELDRRYRRRGLSILGLAFEVTGDFDRDAKQVRRYARRHGVEYPLLVAGLSSKAKASESLPILDRLRSYPTTIFLHGDGRVRAIHSGFSGPATGKDHQELRTRFLELVEELLSEPGAGDP